MRAVINRPVLLIVLALASIVPGSPSAQDTGTVSYVGVLQRRAVDDFANRDFREPLDLVTDDGRRIALEFPEGGPPSAAPGSRMEVSGQLRGAVLTVVSARRLAEPRSLEPPAPPVVGAKKVAVVLFNFEDAPEEPWTAAEIRERIFTAPDSVNAYYQEQSGGTLSLTGKIDPDGDVLGWYTIPVASGGSCDFFQWSAAARAVVAADGKDLSGYDYFVWVWAPVQACAFAGTAGINNSESWINSQGIQYLTFIATHELGHNFGLGHASSLSCTAAGQRVPISSTCVAAEYGDPFDVMGVSGVFHMNDWHKGALGFLDAAEAPSGTTWTVGNAGTVTLTITPEEYAQPGTIQTVRIPGPVLVPVYTGAERYYYLEFRQPFGSSFDVFSPTDPVVNGVSIRLAGGYGEAYLNSYLLDTTPETPTFSDAALASGQTFVEGGCRSLTITTLGVSPAGATVTIAQVPDPGPSAPSGLRADPLDPTRGLLRWDPSSDADVVAYQVFASTPSGISEVGTTGDTELVVEGTSADTVAYWVVAKNRCDRLSAPSSTVSFRFPDSIPTIGFGVPTDPTVMPRDRNLRVRAIVSGAPTERIELYLDDVLLRAARYRGRMRSHRIMWLVDLRRSPPGRHLITLKAYAGAATSAAGARVRNF